MDLASVDGDNAPLARQSRRSVFLAGLLRICLVHRDSAGTPAGSRPRLAGEVADFQI
jgi:hypothetical protein